MITFKKITWRNFLSTGNAPTTIELNTTNTTLIIGTNGAGKSTLLDALCFVLFGKAFRNITKQNLINSINGKQLLVEIEFSVDNKNYKIVRGIKPNIFEIYCNNVLMNQDASVRDYQKVLEEHIIKINYRSFTQVVILGSASFVPFMQLPTGQRREVIEDILDIRIFSLMNQLLREKSQITKDAVLRIEDSVALAREKVSAQKKLIVTISTAKETTIAKLSQKIQEALEEVSLATEKASTIQDQVSKLNEAAATESSIKADLKKVTTAKNKLEARIDAVQERINFMIEKEDCPSCQQKIPHEHKHTSISNAKKDAAKYEEEKATLDECLVKFNKKLEKIAALNRDLTAKNIELSTVNNTIAILNKQVSSMNLEIQEHKVDTANIDEEKNKLKSLAENAVVLLNTKTSLIEEKNLQEIASLLLKDAGIKTAIIREYLPVMNKLINKYLNIMDSYFHFELDESFNEIIKSRFRDEFTYASFSEGEKKRLDLSILFAWRQIAKMKNSVNTNLLIFDEVMDGALDDAGTDSFIQLLQAIIGDSNIFVISHKTEALIDKFDRTIKVDKQNDFSTITVI